MSYRQQQIRFCASKDGTSIAYAICGAGPPLLWVQHWMHHLEFDSENVVWRAWLELLARHNTLIRFDWRGCGLSDRNTRDFAFDHIVDDLAAVINAIKVERFALFGMAGAGSGIAMSYAVRHPEQVTRLILQEAHTMGRLAGNPTFEAAQEADARLKVIELGWHHDTSAYGQFFSSLHIPSANADQMRAYNHLIRQTTSAGNAVRLLRTFWEADLRAVVPRVRCPTLVIHAGVTPSFLLRKGAKSPPSSPTPRSYPSRAKIICSSLPTLRGRNSRPRSPISFASMRLSRRACPWTISRRANAKSWGFSRKVSIIG